MALDPLFSVADAVAALRDLQLSQFLTTFIEASEELESSALTRPLLVKLLKQAGLDDAEVRSGVWDHMDVMKVKRLSVTRESISSSGRESVRHCRSLCVVYLLVLSTFARVVSATRPFLP